MKWSCFPVAILLVGCGWFGQEKEEEKSPETAPKLVGRISSVPGQGGFVLIEAYGRWSVPEGGLLNSAGEDRQATLAASGEKLGQFHAADIRSGRVEPGDLVFHRPVKAPEPVPGPEGEGAESSEENLKNLSEESSTP